MRSEFFVSKSPVGSSKSKTLGLLESALAIVTLYCSLFDNHIKKYLPLTAN